jgi:NADPH-dependent 2,4-dienoyl-CoA reductase/sulfur reductase-like enzyme
MTRSSAWTWLSLQSPLPVSAAPETGLDTSLSESESSSDAARALITLSTAKMPPTSHTHTATRRTSSRTAPTASLDSGQPIPPGAVRDPRVIPDAAEDGSGVSRAPAGSIRTRIMMWDTLVLGSGIGGLTAAAALARRGRSVLVIEQHHTAGGLTQTFTRQGWTFAPGVHYLGNVGPQSGPDGQFGRRPDRARHVGVDDLDNLPGVADP